MKSGDHDGTESRNLRSIAAEIASFLKRHWIQGVLLVPGALAVTVVHEAAHAAAVIASGGEVTQFVVIPGGREWGHVAYRFPQGVVPPSRWIALAPYVLWTVLGLGTWVLSLRSRPFSRWAAPMIWIWWFVVPFADVANAAFPYLVGGDNDFRTAFGAPGIAAWLGIVLAGLGVCLGGYPIQRRLFRDDALSAAAYGVLVGIVVFLLLAGASMTRGG
ncbi:MAG: M50 family metallopeptidase [Verrucomicrobiales bacterium]|nr:M50 family metallopeptidase [Verrucomicrobiales bacterium]